MCLSFKSITAQTSYKLSKINFCVFPNYGIKFKCALLKNDLLVENTRYELIQVTCYKDNKLVQNFSESTEFDVPKYYSEKDKKNKLLLYELPFSKMEIPYGNNQLRLQFAVKSQIKPQETVFLWDTLINVFQPNQLKLIFYVKNLTVSNRDSDGSFWDEMPFADNDPDPHLYLKNGQYNNAYIGWNNTFNIDDKYLIFPIDTTKAINVDVYDVDFISSNDYIVSTFFNYKKSNERKQFNAKARTGNLTYEYISENLDPIRFNKSSQIVSTEDGRIQLHFKLFNFNKLLFKPSITFTIGAQGRVYFCENLSELNDTLSGYVPLFPDEYLKKPTLVFDLKYYDGYSLLKDTLASIREFDVKKLIKNIEHMVVCKENGIVLEDESEYVRKSKYNSIKCKFELTNGSEKWIAINPQKNHFHFHKTDYELEFKNNERLPEQTEVYFKQRFYYFFNNNDSLLIAEKLGSYKLESNFAAITKLDFKIKKALFKPKGEYTINFYGERIILNKSNNFKVSQVSKIILLRRSPLRFSVNENGSYLKNISIGAFNQPVIEKLKRGLKLEYSVETK